MAFNRMVFNRMTSQGNRKVHLIMSSFAKIEHSDRKLYGPRKLLLCGFSSQTQQTFKALLHMLGIDNLPLVWVNSDRPIADLLQLDHDTGSGLDSAMDRALIVAGIAEKELHQLMAGCREAGMQKAFWAALTPTSETWTIGRLLDELKAEQKALSKRNTKSKQGK
jgi:Domain of unknown function (DUF3783)